MRHRQVIGRTRRRRSALAGLLVGLLALPALPATVAAQEPSPSDPTPPTSDQPTDPPTDPREVDPGDAAPDEGLGEQDRARVAEAQASGDDVTLLVAAEDGRVDDAARQLRALGAEVEVVDDEIDYLKAVLAPEDASAAAKVSAIEAVDVDGVIALDDPRPAGADLPAPQTPPGAGTPAVNPYLPSGDIGAPQFVAANPTYDGRGTVVAIIDSGVDLDSAALAETTTAGEPKIVDWFNANAPGDLDGTWVETTGRYNGTFTGAAAPWTAPLSGGPYSFGVLSETADDLGSGELGGDLDRDGTTGESFGVIQDRYSRAVYVDVDQDHDFTDEAAMSDFADGNRDVGHLGTDDPATPVQESVAFVVGTHESNENPASTDPSQVNIGIAGSAHGTHVAGIAAGNGLFGGAMDGVAPGAQVMAVKACLSTSSCTNGGIIDGILHAAQEGADVANMSIGGLPSLNDGSGARNELIDRTIDEYDMQLVVSAGNDGAGANSVGDPGVATSTISVGASISQATWRSNYGSDSDRAMALIPFSSRGPREDGGFKPDVVAPGSAIATIPAWQNGSPVFGTYALPPGYGMLNGTSMSSPQVAGAAALLIGAYKATHGGARPDPAALRDAIRASADPIAGVGAYEQGMGLVDVAGAWGRLQAGYAPHAITATVPVTTPLAGFLTVPGRGVGIHERDGLVAGGSTVTRTYTLTRTSGPSGSVVTPVTWVGNDGTFASADRVSLPLGVPVSFPVRIAPTTAGAHSALMVVDDPGTAGVDLATMNAAFVAQPFVDGVATLSGTVPRNGTRHLFVQVPPGKHTLSVRLTGGGAAAGSGQVRFLRYHPYGSPVDPTATTSCYTPDAGAGCVTGSPSSRTQAEAFPGTWEIVVEARRTSDVAAAPFILQASLARAVVSPRRDVMAPLESGVPTPRSYTVTNLGPPVTAQARGGPLASTIVRTPTIANGVTQQYQVVVPPGASQLSARIGSPADAGADLDLHLFDCTSGTCVTVAQSADGDAEESVAVADPAAGVWVVLVDGFGVPSGSTTFDYVDSITSAAYGSVSVTDSMTARATAESWSVNGLVTVNTQPAPGRHLTGAVRVVTDAETVIGSGVVEIGSGGAVTATTTTLTTSANPSIAGEAITLEAEVDAATGTPGGTVEIFDGTNLIASLVLNGGRAELVTDDLGEGSHELRAEYLSAGVHVDSESATLTQVVGAEPIPVTPVADAGSDRTVAPGDTVDLTAAGSSHPDEASLQFAWLQDGGPAVTLSDPNASLTSFTAPAGPATLVFSVGVTDPARNADTDTVTITVDGPPTADAGDDQTVDPDDTVTLDGSESADPDVADVLTYAWTQTDGPTVTLTGPDTASPTFTAPDAGTLTFDLTVDDGHVDDTDAVVVTVNEAPTADAGPDRTANAGATVALDGTGSDDPEDGVLTYAWAQDAGPDVTLTGADTATPTLTVPTSGPLTFTLTVTDPRGVTGTDTVTVVVNGAPVADAGDDQRVAEGTPVTLDATDSSDPGQVLTWSWTQHSGPPVTLTSPATASPSFTAPDGPATLLFSVTVVDPLGLSGTDLVTVTVATPLAIEAQLATAPNPGGSIGLSSTPTSDDASDLTYEWEQTAGPTVALATPDEQDTTFAAPAAGTSVTFEVTITDSLGQTASDTITVTVNAPPTADAGGAQTVDPGDTVTLTGSGTDTETVDLGHEWTVASGPSVSLVDATSATATFTAPAGPATIVLELEVTDEHGLSATDTVTITVDGAPVVDAGEDQLVTPGAGVTLDGTETEDPEGGDLDLLWAQESGPIVALIGIDTATPTFPAASSGPATYVFILSATDGRGNVGTDSVTITVDGAPTADAGDDQTVNPTTTVTLDGSGSTDPDEGDDLTYAWTQDDGPEVTLTGADTASPTFTAPAGPDDLTFTLTVTDEHDVSATDQVAVTVNGIPEASGGPAQTVDQGDVVALDATGSTDPDEDALTFGWTQEAGPAVTLTGGDTATPSFTAPAGPASLVFVVTVTDVHGAEDTSAVVVTIVPPLTPTEVWVVEVYSTFLHRAPDATGLTYWSLRLGSGTPRLTVVRNIALSPEATRGPIVGDLYDRLLDRNPGAGDRIYWAGRLHAGTPFSWVERHLLASAERYAASGGTNTTYVTDLYQRILGRDGGDNEIAYWVNRLGSGAPRLATVDALLNTPEARAVRVAEVAEAALGRPATGPERAELGRAYATTRDPRTVAMAAFLLRP